MQNPINPINPINANTWVASDHHFGHKQIGEYEPLRNIWKDLGYGSMEDMLIKQHNEVVKPEDTVLFLGDFSWDNPQNWVDKLNGKKYLILGNHDRKGDISYKGFEYIFRGMYVDIAGYLFKSASDDPLLSTVIMEYNYDYVCFSHYAIGNDDVYDRQSKGNIERRKKIISSVFNKHKGWSRGTNIHGHLHSHLANSKEYIYKNACLEHNMFYPVRLRDLLKD
jgi:calcineurin-like phosphoesterase family protein